MKEFAIKSNDAGQRLDRFVGKAVPLLPESLLQKYIRLKRSSFTSTTSFLKSRGRKTPTSKWAPRV